MSQIFYAEQADFHILKFVGDVRLSQSPLISNFLLKMRKLDNCCGIVVDLSETVAIDSTALGLIAKLGIICRENFALTLSIVSPRVDISRLLESMSMQEVAIITSQPLTDSAGFEELPEQVVSETHLLNEVLEAHRTLMGLATDNEEKFRDLVSKLQEEQTTSSHL